MGGRRRRGGDPRRLGRCRPERFSVGTGGIEPYGGQAGTDFVHEGGGPANVRLGIGG